MSTKVHKVTVLVVDHDDVGRGVIDVLENAHYPNHCISPQVMHIETREVEWSDNHPLNKRDTHRAEYERLFGSDSEY